MTTYQKNFISIITNRLPEGEKLVDFISRLIHVGREASYRRIRCEVEFTLSEVVTIAKTLNINLTSLIIREGGDKVTCNLRLIEDTSIYSVYNKKIEADLNVLEGFEKRSNLTLSFISAAIPDVFYFDFPYLTKLRLLKIQFNNAVLHPMALAQMELPKETATIQARYMKELQLFDLVFILGPDMLTSIVNDIQYFYRFNLITEVEKIALQTELTALLQLIHDIASSGMYLDNKVSMYVSHLSIDISHAVITSRDLEASSIDLQFPNTILSFDQSFTEAQTKNLHIIKKSSSLISQASELEKMNFLNKQRLILSHL